MSEEKHGYIAAPAVPKEAKERYETLLLVLNGELTVTEGAKRLGMSRNRFQTIRHRALAGMLAEASKKKPGRKPRTEQAANQEGELRRLRAENQKLQRENDESVKLLGAASILLQERIGMRPRYRKHKTPGAAGSEGTGEDPAGTARWKLETARMLTMNLGSSALAATALNAGASTVRRMANRERRGVVLVQRRGPGPKGPPAEAAVASVVALVRESEGLFGADTLRRCVPEMSRRDAAAIKAVTETAMERERKAAAVQILIAAPGVLRGFDSMHMNTQDGVRHFLACTDGCVPFRTSGRLVERYTGPVVADVLDRDFTENGAPLVVRDDRAQQHETADVLRVCEKHGVLVLHGPPRYGQFYGQHERQNREHRGFTNHLGLVAARAVELAIPRMLHVLNAVWKRASLGWKTAQEVWMNRPAITVDRVWLGDHVDAMTERIRIELTARGESVFQARRFAIEAALTQLGLLRRVSGGHR